MSAGDSINFRIGGDASGALAANDKLKRSEDEVIESKRKAATISNSTAKRIIRDVETQQERFKRLRKEIYNGWNSNKLTTQEYGRAVRKLEKDYAATEGQFRKFAKSTKDEMADMEDSATGFGEVIGTWGPRVVSALGLMQSLRVGFQEIEQSIQNSGEGVRESASGLGQLRQLASTQQEFDALQNTAKKFYLSGAAGSLGEAASAVFSLSSANLLDTDSERLFLQLGARGVVPELGTFARAIRTQLAAYGREETGDAVQIASKAFAASAYSPASVEELLEAASLPGGTARALGISDEEVLSATALLATSTGSATVGATALRSFLSSTAQIEEFEGKSIFERVKLLKSKNLSIAQLLKSPSDGGLGRKEAVRAFTDLEGSLPLLSEITGSVNAANFNRSAIDTKLNFVDPTGEAARLERSIKAQAALTQEATGARRLITEAAEDRFAAEQAEFGAVGSVGVGVNYLFRNAGGLVAGQTGREGFASLTLEERAATEALKEMPKELAKLNATVERLLGEQVAEQKNTKDEVKKKEGLTVTGE